MDLFAVALRALEGGRRVAIATVIGAHGSTPRHLGARMMVADDGGQWGTVGGGKIEQLVAAAAREVAGGAAPRVVAQHLVRDLAMCCGGAMEVVVTPATRDAMQAAAGARGVTLETPLDGAPLVVRSTRPGDPPRHRPAIRDGALVERLGGGERVIVFGTGHVAQSLGPLLDRLGFDVIACDDNETGALAAAPPWAKQVIESFDAAEVERALGGFDDDYVLIVTRDHAIDQQLLEKLIDKGGIGYLGMIGSRGKVGRFRKRLEAKGLYDAATWARLRAPIGFDIGAETPDEIAVAIAAELVAHRRLGVTRAGDWSPPAGRAVTTGCVILAAGAGTRLGGVAKALLGTPSFLAQIIATAHADDVVVVVGPPFGDAVAAEAARLGARVVVNPAPERGMASSIALGFAAVRGDAAWLWPVDHPAVHGATLAALAAALPGHDVARPRHHGRGGHPPLVAARVWPALAAMRLEPARATTTTARDVLAAVDVCDVEVDDPGCVRDIDTPEDL